MDPTIIIIIIIIIDIFGFSSLYKIDWVGSFYLILFGFNKMNKWKRN